MVEWLFLAEEVAERGFIAHSLCESIFTEANTLDELRAAVREAVECHFDDAHRPKVIRLHIVREEGLPA